MDIRWNLSNTRIQQSFKESDSRLEPGKGAKDCLKVLKNAKKN